MSFKIKYIHGQCAHRDESAFSQRPIIEQLLYIYSAARYSAAAITLCLEMKAVNEKNWAIVKKWGQAPYQLKVVARYDLSLK